MKIADWLSSGTDELKSAGIPSARLDCLLLLEDSLGYTRIQVLARLNEEVPSDILSILNTQLARRKNREPLAYIRGHVEFYGRNFIVNNSVLIPRPETEALIDMITALKHVKNPTIADVGTGSGAIGITIALENPTARVFGYDINLKALRTAELNNRQFETNIFLAKSDLLDGIEQSFDIIVANLPYVSRSQHVSEETAYEPSVALYANDDGLAVITRFISQVSAQRNLTPQGYLILESEPRQHHAIEAHAKKYGFKLIRTDKFIQLFGCST